jgi:hypothetical protein
VRSISTDLWKKKKEKIEAITDAAYETQFETHRGNAVFIGSDFLDTIILQCQAPAKQQ